MLLSARSEAGSSLVEQAYAVLKRNKGQCGRHQQQQSSLMLTAGQKHAEAWASQPRVPTTARHTRTRPQNTLA